MTTETKPTNGRPANVNRIGLAQQEYRGNESTLCQGCGHNSITSQIIAAAFDLSLRPNEIIKMSGIGCSSKTPAYFMNRAHGFNTLHGRMPSVTTGAVHIIRRVLVQAGQMLIHVVQGQVDGAGYMFADIFARLAHIQDSDGFFL